MLLLNECILAPGGDEIEKKLEVLRIMIDSMTLSSPQDTDA